MIFDRICINDNFSNGPFIWQMLHFMWNVIWKMPCTYHGNGVVVKCIHWYKSKKPCPWKLQVISHMNWYQYRFHPAFTNMNFLCKSCLVRYKFYLSRAWFLSVILNFFTDSTNHTISPRILRWGGMSVQEMLVRPLLNHPLPYKTHPLLSINEHITIIIQILITVAFMSCP